MSRATPRASFTGTDRFGLNQIRAERPPLPAGEIAKEESVARISAYADLGGF